MLVESSLTIIPLLYAVLLIITALPSEDVAKLDSIIATQDCSAFSLATTIASSTSFIV